MKHLQTIREYVWIGAGRIANSTAVDCVLHGSVVVITALIALLLMVNVPTAVPLHLLDIAAIACAGLMFSNLIKVWYESWMGMGTAVYAVFVVVWMVLTIFVVVVKSNLAALALE